MSETLRALGLCRRAGALVCGTPMICAELPSGKILMVLEAADTSEGTHKKITDKCGYYKTPHIRLSVNGESLAAAVGKSGALAAVAVKEKNLAILVEGALARDGKDNYQTLL